MGRLITAAEFAVKSTLSRRTIYAHNGRPGFPTAIPVSDRRFAYDEDEVDTYLRELKRRADEARGQQVAS